MAKVIRVLVTLLIVQMVLVIWLYTRGSDLAAFQSSEAVLGLKAAEIDGVKIEQKGEPSLSLKKREDRWVLPESGDFPADAGKAADFVNKFTEIKKSWPVAKTTVAAKQLKVAEDNFERKISFARGDQVLKSLYLGSSPAFRKVHARLDGDPYVYEIEYSAFEADPKKTAWYDKGLLRPSRDQIAAIHLNGLVLKNTDAGLQLEGLQETEEINKEEAAAVLSGITGLSYDEMLGTEQKEDYQKLPLVLEFKVELKNGDQRAYTVSGPLSGEEKYLLKSSQYPFYFKAAKGAFDKLREVNREKLAKLKPAPEAVASTPTASQAEVQESAAPESPVAEEKK